MSAASIATTLRARAPKVGLILIIAAVIGALSAIDVFLENAQETELAAQARTSYEDGMQLLQAGKAEEAVETLRKAYVLERSNVGYELQLVAALTMAGKTREAEPLANEVLDADRNNGAANLVVARLRRKEGKMAEAAAYYHRAIYGEWPQNPRAHRIASRLELIDFLIRQDQKNSLLAELLPLEQEAGKNRDIQAQVARLFLTAAVPGRAAAAYRQLIHEEPKNPDWHAGLGESDLATGDYHGARSEFAWASAHRPDDADLKVSLQLAGTLAALDPTPRWLPSAEKYQRSVKILGSAQEILEECLQSVPNGGSENQDLLLQQAAGAMEATPPPQTFNEASERLLALALRVWQARLNTCGASTAPGEEALGFIMAKLTNQQ